MRIGQFIAVKKKNWPRICVLRPRIRLWLTFIIHLPYIFGKKLSFSTFFHKKSQIDQFIAVKMENWPRIRVPRPRISLGSTFKIHSPYINLLNCEMSSAIPLFLKKKMWIGQFIAVKMKNWPRIRVLRPRISPETTFRDFWETSNFYFFFYFSD